MRTILLCLSIVGLLSACGRPVKTQDEVHITDGTVQTITDSCTTACSDHDGVAKVTPGLEPCCVCQDDTPYFCL